jgi:hypothetical protein
VQHGAHERFVIVGEANEELGACDETTLPHVFEDHVPERAAALRRAFVQALNLAPVGPKPEAEHVRADFPAHALSFELVHEIEKNLIRNLREGGAHAASGGELGNENRRLPDDRVDEGFDGHAGAEWRTLHHTVRSASVRGDTNVPPRVDVGAAISFVVGAPAPTQGASGRSLRWTSPDGDTRDRHDARDVSQREMRPRSRLLPGAR